MLWKERTAVERTEVSVVSFELSTDTASVALRALGLNEECEGGLMPGWMEPQ
jgi:hypothetical protein